MTKNRPPTRGRKKPRTIHMDDGWLTGIVFDSDLYLAVCIARRRLDGWNEKRARKSWDAIWAAFLAWGAEQDNNSDAPALEPPPTSERAPLWVSRPAELLLLLREEQYEPVTKLLEIISFEQALAVIVLHEAAAAHEGKTLILRSGHKLPNAHSMAALRGALILAELGNTATITKLQGSYEKTIRELGKALFSEIGPHFRRGKKVVDGASKGGQNRGKPRGTRLQLYEQWKTEKEKLHRERPNSCNKHLNETIAKRHGVSYKTVERRTPKLGAT